MSAPPADRPTVLVADDDEDLRGALTELVSHSLPCRVIAARDGVEALAALRAGGVDVAVIDQRMPGLTGAEVIRAARAEGIATRFVLITAAVNVAQLAGELGLDPWLGKPFGLDALIATLHRALAAPR